MKRFLICAAFSASALAQTSAEQFVRSAGNYLGTLEWISVFGHSECSSYAPKNMPSYMAALDSEVLPEVSNEERAEVREKFMLVRPVVSRQANQQIPQLISAAKQDDRKTACGKVLGALMSSHATALERWSKAKAN